MELHHAARHAFLVLTGVLAAGFVRSGGTPMLGMMEGDPESGDHAVSRS